jgi:hypothetical protein
MKTSVAAVCLMLVASAAQAQVSAFISANALAQQPATSDFSQTGSGPSRQEVATLSSEQQFGTSLAYDVGGGLVRRLGGHWKLGLGLAVSRAQDNTAATVSLTLPHPIVFYRPGTAASTTDEKLERRETGAHIQAVLETGSGPVAVRLFAGPSYIRLAHTLVSDVQIGETLDLSPQLPYAVSITGVETSEATASAWGYHAGADVGVFFSRHVGVGGLVRYSRATAKLPNALQTAIDGSSDANSEETLGGLSIGGGLRLRF